jgi:hypothetical protein
VLPLEAICSTIERNLRELLACSAEVRMLVGHEAAGASAEHAAAPSSGGGSRTDEFGELTGEAGRACAPGSSSGMRWPHHTPRSKL